MKILKLHKLKLEMFPLQLTEVNIILSFKYFLFFKYYY